MTNPKTANRDRGAMAKIKNEDVIFKIYTNMSKRGMLEIQTVNGGLVFFIELYLYL